MELSISSIALKESLSFFVYTMAELAVLFIGISFLVGVINEYLPQEKVKQWLSGRNGKGYILGSLLGALTPFCSCSTIPFMVGLIRAKAGFGPTMAFLFTSPLVNPIIIPLFAALIGIKITVIYALTAILLSISVGYLLERFGFAQYIKTDITADSCSDCNEVSDKGTIPVNQTSCCGDSPQTELQPVLARENSSGPTIATVQGPPIPIASVTTKSSTWGRIFYDAVKLYKSMLPFIIIGVTIGAVIHGFLPADFVATVAGSDNPFAIPVSAVIGVPLYLRVSTMIPIAATLIAKGMSIGAVLALIIGGAGASLPELAMLKGLFRIPLLAAFISSVIFMAVFTGFFVNYLVL